MKAPPGPAAVPGKAKPKAKAASRAARAGKPRQPASKPTPAPRRGAAAKPPAGAAGPGKGDWREATWARMRSLILEADPAMTEERKWRKASNAMAGIPVWSHDGMVCTGETYTNVVKLTFARGASLPDPAGLFNSSLEGHTRRAIDIREGETVDAAAFKALVKAAVAHNTGPAETKR